MASRKRTGGGPSEEVQLDRVEECYAAALRQSAYKGSSNVQDFVLPPETAPPAVASTSTGTATSAASAPASPRASTSGGTMINEGASTSAAARASDTPRPPQPPKRARFMPPTPLADVFGPRPPTATPVTEEQPQQANTDAGNPYS